MKTELITLAPHNCIVKAISHKNNVVADMLNPDGSVCSIVIHKKYFNQINAHGEVCGRLRSTEDGLIIFEGFSFR